MRSPTLLVASLISFLGLQLASCNDVSATPFVALNPQSPSESETGYGFSTITISTPISMTGLPYGPPVPCELPDEMYRHRRDCPVPVNDTKILPGTSKCPCSIPRNHTLPVPMASERLTVTHTVTSLSCSGLPLRTMTGDYLSINFPAIDYAAADTSETTSSASATALNKSTSSYTLPRATTSWPTWNTSTILSTTILSNSEADSAPGTSTDTIIVSLVTASPTTNINTLTSAGTTSTFASAPSLSPTSKSAANRQVSPPRVFTWLITIALILACQAATAMANAEANPIADLAMLNTTTTTTSAGATQTSQPAVIPGVSTTTSYISTTWITASVAKPRTSSSSASTSNGDFIQFPSGSRANLLRPPQSTISGIFSTVVVSAACLLGVAFVAVCM